MKKFIILLISLTMLSASLACTLTIPVTATQPRVTTAADEALSRITDLATMPAPAAIEADGAKVREWKP